MKAYTQRAKLEEDHGDDEKRILKLVQTLNLLIRT